MAVDRGKTDRPMCRSRRPKEKSAREEGRAGQTAAGDAAADAVVGEKGKTETQSLG